MLRAPPSVRPRCMELACCQGSAPYLGARVHCKADAQVIKLKALLLWRAGALRAGARRPGLASRTSLRKGGGGTARCDTPAGCAAWFGLALRTCSGLAQRVRLCSHVERDEGCVEAVHTRTEEGMQKVCRRYAEGMQKACNRTACHRVASSGKVIHPCMLYRKLKVARQSAAAAS